MRTRTGGTARSTVHYAHKSGHARWERTWRCSLNNAYNKTEAKRISRGRLPRMGTPVGHSAHQPPRLPTPAPPTHTSASVTHCVLWHVRESTPPPELLANLAAKGIRLTEAFDPYEAVARVALLERHNDARAAAHSPSDEASAGEVPPAPARDAIILLMIRPDNLPGASDVVDAVRRFAPRTACWQFDVRTNPMLRPVVEDDVAAWPSLVASRRDQLGSSSAHREASSGLASDHRLSAAAGLESAIGPGEKAGGTPASRNVGGSVCTTGTGMPDVHVRNRHVDAAKNR